MNAGIPGTGLATAFYVLWSLLMPVVELRRRHAGLPTARGWRFVGRHLAVGVGLIGFAVATTVALASVAAVQPAGPLWRLGGSFLAARALPLVVVAGLALALGRRRGRRRAAAGRRAGSPAWARLEALAAEALACLLAVRALGVTPVSCAWALVSLGVLVVVAFPPPRPRAAGAGGARMERRARARRAGVMVAIANGTLAVTLAALVWLGGTALVPGPGPGGGAPLGAGSASAPAAP